MLISFRRPHVHNGEEAERGRRESDTRPEDVSHNRSHTPRHAAATRRRFLRRRTRASGPGSRPPDLALIRASASVILLLDSWTDIDIRTQLKKWYDVLVLRIFDCCVASYLPPMM